jgi:BASS family bile acid:Na+ symporter
MEWLFALTMLGIGLVLKPEDFAPIFTKPHLVLLGTLAQFAIMPALGFFVAKLLRLEPDLALGVILCGAAPAAMASTVMSYLAKADVAYSAALTCSTTLVAPILTPSFTYLFAHTFIHVEFLPMFFSIIRMVIIPLLLGLGLKLLLGGKIDPIVKVFPSLSALFITLICGLVVALNKEKLASVSLIILIAVNLHSGLGLVLGYGAGILYRFDKKRRRTLSFEVGMQNAGLGAMLSLKHFSPQAALPNVVFAICSLMITSVLAEIWSRKE